jgi:hypothetical protein
MNILMQYTSFILVLQRETTSYAFALRYREETSYCIEYKETFCQDGWRSVGSFPNVFDSQTHILNISQMKSIAEAIGLPSHSTPQTTVELIIGISYPFLMQDSFYASLERKVNPNKATSDSIESIKFRRGHVHSPSHLLKYP